MKRSHYMIKGKNDTIEFWSDSEELVSKVRDMMELLMPRRCSCCGKEKEITRKFRLPIMSDCGMLPAEMNLCEDCAGEILRKYYEIAHENGHSGLRAFAGEKE